MVAASISILVADFRNTARDSTLGPIVTEAFRTGLGQSRSIAVMPATALRVYTPGNNLAEVLERLRSIYCSTIAYEVEHITRHEQRSWLRKQIESGTHLAPVSPVASSEGESSTPACQPNWRAMPRATGSRFKTRFVIWSSSTPPGTSLRR